MMKKRIFALSLIFVACFQTFSQENSFEPETFKSLEKTEKQDRIYSLFDQDEVPSEDYFIKLFTDLIEAGSLSPDLRSRNKKQSLFDACVRTGYYAAADLLLEKGYSPNQRCFNCNGETALHIAIIQYGELKEKDSALATLVYKLLQKGADPDLRDMDGWTPFHWVIKNKDATLFEIFMREDVKFNYQLATLKGLGYLQFFDKEWDEDEYRDKLMTKSGLKYPPTKKEIKEKAQAAKDKKKEAKEATKEKKEKN